MHVTILISALKIVTDVHIASHFTQKKVRTTLSDVVHASLEQSLGTVIFKVLNYIPRSCIVHIDTTGFLFMVR